VTGIVGAALELVYSTGERSPRDDGIVLNAAGWARREAGVGVERMVVVNGREGAFSMSKRALAKEN